MKQRKNRPPQYYTITWEGKPYEDILSRLGAVVGKSRTFLQRRLDEGMTIQQAVDARVLTGSERRIRNTAIRLTSDEKIRNKCEPAWVRFSFPKEQGPGRGPESIT